MALTRIHHPALGATAEVPAESLDIWRGLGWTQPDETPASDEPIAADVPTPTPATDEPVDLTEPKPRRNR